MAGADGPGANVPASATAPGEESPGAVPGSEPGSAPAGATPDVYAFSGTTPEGGTFSGEDLAGTPAVLWFWAPWCPTCRSQISTVTGLAEQYAGEVTVVAVGGLDSEDAILGLADDIPHVVHVVDDEGGVWRHFGVTQQSTYTVIDGDGTIVSEGYLTNDEVTSLVADLAG